VIGACVYHRHQSNTRPHLYPHSHTQTQPATPSPGRAGSSSSKKPGGAVHSPASAKTATVALLAAIMGNVLEFYDFSVYA
jgi:hypothetical protein